MQKEPKQAQIEKIVSTVSSAKLESYVRKIGQLRHSTYDVRNRIRIPWYRCSAALDQSELESCSKVVLMCNLTAANAPEGRRLSRPTEIVNVVATLKGKTDPERMYVVSGHYDSRVTDVMDAKAMRRAPMMMHPVRPP